MPTQQPKLLDRLRHACRVRHYSIRTEDAYHDWAERYIRFHGLRHPNTLGEAEVNAFLTHLAVEGHMAASTQNRAMAALPLLYGHVPGRPAEELGRIVRAKRPKRLPVVLTEEEVGRVLAHMEGVPRLLARLPSGSGVRPGSRPSRGQL